VSVKALSGWAFEMALKPGADGSLFEKYALGPYLRDNLFVIAAILKSE
jgi:hypothetical protein